MAGSRPRAKIVDDSSHIAHSDGHFVSGAATPISAVRSWRRRHLRRPFRCREPYTWVKPRVVQVPDGTEGSLATPEWRRLAELKQT